MSSKHYHYAKGQHRSHVNHGFQCKDKALSTYVNSIIEGSNISGIKIDPSLIDNPSYSQLAANIQLYADLANTVALTSETLKKELNTSLIPPYLVDLLNQLTDMSLIQFNIHNEILFTLKSILTEEKAIAQLASTTRQNPTQHCHEKSVPFQKKRYK